MSAIAGLFHLSGKPVEKNDLQDMVDRLAHRGPDDHGTWCNGAVGLGHRMLWTTPESVRDRLPHCHTDSTGTLVITADARIDNRQELLDHLLPSALVNKHSTDVELILALYQRWGGLCPERLVGDFAFAIWDDRRQHLFCARDPIGVKPFYYYASQDLFVFATEIKALLSRAEVPDRLSETRIGDHLLGIASDPGLTFYDEILRLPPAHCMTISRTQRQLRRYWSLEPEREVRFASDAEYSEAFLEIFTEAVRCRMRTAYPVGSFLSGGLDSSAVTAVAEQLLSQSGGRLHTYSTVFDQITACDERQYIDKVLTTGTYTPHFVHAERVPLFADIDSILWHEDEALSGHGLFLTWQHLTTAGKQDVRILLSGLGGDEVVSYGTGRLSELAHAGHWITLLHEIRGVLRARDGQLWQAWWRYVKHFGLKPRIPAFVRTNRLLWRLRHRLAEKTQEGGDPVRPLPAQTLLDPEFDRRSGATARFRSQLNSHPDRALTERERHFAILGSSTHALALEELDKVAAAHGCEFRFPFWDRRLVAFCLALPSHQKLHNGWQRYVLRTAMAGRLPVEVQWRTDKSEFSPFLSHAFQDYGREHVEQILYKDAHLLAPYIDIRLMQRTFDQFLTGKCVQEHFLMLLHAVSLGHWLRHRDRSAV